MKLQCKIEVEGWISEKKKKEAWFSHRLDTAAAPAFIFFLMLPLMESITLCPCLKQLFGYAL
jgi:hypothetical protein